MHDYRSIDNWLYHACKDIRYAPDHAAVQAELRAHYEDAFDALTGSGMTEADAKELALLGTDGKVWLGRYQRYQYLPFLYQPNGYSLQECDNLDGTAYFCEAALAAEHAYLVLRDERAAAVEMTVRFTLDGLQHEEVMTGWDVGNGIFQLDLNEMLNMAQERVYDSIDRTTYDRSLYWFVFPSHLGLRAFDAYDIRAYDAAGNEIGCWTA